MIWFTIMLLVFIQGISSRVVDNKQKLEDNEDSVVSIYENVRLFADILSITNSPFVNNILDVIWARSSVLRPARNFGQEGVIDYIPKVINNWMVPQLLEKVDVIREEFSKSSLWKTITNQIDMQKLNQIFSDEETKSFSYDKFMELIENHSFRKHWISVATNKISWYIACYVDPATHKKFASPTLVTINNFLKKIGVPKANLLDLDKPSESLTNFINYFSKNFLFYPVDSKEYVKPFVVYVQNLLSTAKEIVTHRTDPERLKNILINTINMDIIEPTLRVNRAYRFLMQNPQCDRYVMCLVNTEEIDDPSLPGVKKALTKGTSLIASWFLAGKTKSSFGMLYNYILESTYCKVEEMEECQHFHVEELKVKIPYEHREL